MLDGGVERRREPLLEVRGLGVRRGREVLQKPLAPLLVARPTIRAAMRGDAGPTGSAKAAVSDLSVPEPRVPGPAAEPAPSWQPRLHRCRVGRNQPGTRLGSHHNRRRI
jgi:hypothetical protein